jgi:hypothetical protein
MKAGAYINMERIVHIQNKQGLSFFQVTIRTKKDT